MYGADDEFGVSNNLHYGAVTLDGGAVLNVGAYSTLQVDGLLRVMGGSSLTVGIETALSMSNSVEVTNNSTLTLGGAACCR